MQNKVNYDFRFYMMFFGILLFVLYNLSYGPFVEERMSKRDFRFDTTSIKGILDYIDINSRFVGIRIQGKKDTLIFDPEAIYENNKRIYFLDIAEKGDSVIKSKFANTLELKTNKDNKVYQFYLQFSHR